MTLYLYGIILANDLIPFGNIGFAEREVSVITQGRLEAVVGPVPAEDWSNLSRDKLLQLLLSHQRTLEAVMQKGCSVLPFKFGTTISDEKECLRLLTAEQEFFLNKMERFRDCAEIELIATWDVKAMLGEIAKTDPEILSSTKDGIRDVEHQLLVGKLLAGALQKRAGQWQGEIRQALRVHAEDTAEHDLFTDAMLLNCSFLVQRDKEKSFYTALDKADIAFGGKLRFKCVGPLPPHSFATLSLKRFDPRKISAAASYLRLDGSATAEAVKRSYFELARTCHPDIRPDLSSEKFDELNRSYALVFDYCRDKPRQLSRQAVEQSVRVECAMP